MHHKLRKDGIQSKRYVYISAVIVLALLTLGSYFVYKTYGNHPEARTPKNGSASQHRPSELPRELTSKILFVGDTYWGRYMNQWSQASPHKEAYPFSGLSSFHREQYNAWIANLECPTVPGITQTPTQEDATLMFNCNPSYLGEAKKWFNAVSLANNHTDNQGADGFRETQKQLTNNGITYFGHYDPEAYEELCTVIAVQTNSQEALPLALCGYHGVFKIPSDASLAVIKKYATYMPVITMPHMGSEYKTSSDTIREKTFRTMIDNGADAVIAAHPHWVQNSEAYKGKPIFYSIGNFIFDQQANQEVTQSAPIAVTLTMPTKDTKTIQTWTQLLKTCRVKQTCIAEAEKQHLAKLPVHLAYDVVPGDSSNKLTKLASPETAQDVLNRLNWDATEQQLTAQ
jgi:poly-gamma-glutamate capsule biosynthesis protein CapA/YwtB (metallophosphatase superfamily)